MQITFDLNDLQLTTGLAKLKERASDLSPVLKMIAMLGENQAIESFNSSKSPAGVAWKQSWRVKGKGGKTLIHHGILRNSLSSRADKKSAVWGVGVSYGLIHQFGGVISAKGGGSLAFTGGDGRLRLVKSVTIPARPFLPEKLEQLDQDAIIDIISAHFD
jgi:phage gpG-like protein